MRRRGGSEDERMDRSYPVRTPCAARMPGVHVSPRELSSRSASVSSRATARRPRGISCEDRVAGLASVTVGRAIPTATQNSQARWSAQRRGTQKTAARDAGGAPSLGEGEPPRDALVRPGRSPFLLHGPARGSLPAEGCCRFLRPSALRPLRGRLRILRRCWTARSNCIARSAMEGSSRPSSSEAQPQRRSSSSLIPRRAGPTLVMTLS